MSRADLERYPLPRHSLFSKLSTGRAVGVLAVTTYRYCGLHLSAVSAEIASRQSEPENLPTLASHVCYRWYSRCRVVPCARPKPCNGTLRILSDVNASEVKLCEPGALPQHPLRHPFPFRSYVLVLCDGGARGTNAKTIVKLRQL
jgi:hypothetical protein